MADMYTAKDGLYRPGAESSLIDNGEYIEGFDYDMDGQQRVGLPDCGADEYSEEAVKYAPLDIYTAGPTNKWWIYVMYNGYDDAGMDSGTELDVEDGKITASRTIETFQNEASPVSKTVILAEYDGKRLLNMTSQTQNIYKLGTYKYSLSLDYNKEHTYKAFFWNTSGEAYIPLERETSFK